MREKTLTLIILHIAVFLAGWTGIFGRLISLGGLPLVWYRMMTSVVVLTAVLGCMRRLHHTSWKEARCSYTSHPDGHIRSLYAGKKSYPMQGE